MTSFHQNDTLDICLILTNQSSNCTLNTQCFVPYCPATRQVVIKEILDQACQRGVPLSDAQIFLVDFSNRMNVFMGTYPHACNFVVSLESVMNNSIQISFRPSAENLMIDERVEFVARPKKVRERSIEEALQAIKQWRSLYDSADVTGKRIYTLDEAAKKVGMAKKTLDDYYTHLRVAIQHNFNIERYREAKIGILRKFVKIAREQGEQGLMQKMPECILDNDISKFWADLEDM